LRKNKFFVFVILFLLFQPLYAVSAFGPEVRIQTSEEAFANSPVGIIVIVKYLAGQAAFDITVNYGDGSPSETKGCAIDPTSTRRECSVRFVHIYTSPGNYLINALAQLKGSGGGIAGSDSFTIQIEEWNPPSPPSSPSGTGGSGSGISGITNINPISATTFGEILDRIATALFFMAIFITPFLIAVGGFLMSSGIPSRIIMGKRIILIASAIFGVVALFKLVTSLTVDIIK